MMKNKTKITRSMIERDAQYVLDFISNHDYEIPSSGKILSVVFMFFLPALILQVFLCIADYLLYIKTGFDWVSLFGVMVFSSIPLLFYWGALCISLYSSVSALLCVPLDVLKNTVLYEVVYQKIKRYSFIIMGFNVIVGILLLRTDHVFVALSGFGWFASLIVGGLSFSYSISQYFTPQVMAVLNKINKVISPSAVAK
ncbi:hypothetical protein ID251_004699 [Salmonella enterica]|uniref:hypothetical protein n=1 Tax=Salmonella enterica TaxID=28901 RepID=UPI0009AF0D3E|nr:hypothetical protein [Salmonella enterica]EBV8441052.1 hypothetical protein [Salmonella enterica subsp. enterica serovar Chester]EBX8913794.1 hypothetical protein [Salmonella enterica subsp. enterica serovar Agoueve]EDP1393749.1 hypothetical protein [Salmonella enterica subsp. enterica serovar Reading]EDV4423944.1 hypothetical protein [Salmonella enterica subsp. enterica]EEB0571191.1 hypothetical protein [Salmonella enterica subsp. enterica serovar Kintambo]